MNWAYGVTTVPIRKDSLLPTTLLSLKKAGFEAPLLFVDGIGHRDAIDYEEKYKLEVVARHPTIRAYGNWILALAELYIRNPKADKYALFQDDLAAYRNLRGYLDRCQYPTKGYWNLYTFPSNQEIAPKDTAGNRLKGWYMSNQFGRGAVGLVFDRVTVTMLLSNQDMVDRPQDPHRGHKAIDGGVVNALAKLGWKEYVHYPSLLQHLGKKSTVGNPPHPSAPSFLGEDYDALLLPAGPPLPAALRGNSRPLTTKGNKQQGQVNSSSSPQHKSVRLVARPPRDTVVNMWKGWKGKQTEKVELKTNKVENKPKEDKNS